MTNLNGSHLTKDVLPAPVSMRTHLRGRVDNLKIKQRDGLQSLFEAVSNALQSISVSERKDGEIFIELFRDLSQPVIKGLEVPEEDSQERSLQPIQDICIQDNGLGFNKENFDSFLTLDSRFKAALGGKGVGRLVWLKMFEQAEIDSVYLEKGIKYRRSFVFSLNSDTGFSDFNLSETRLPCRTIITLRGLLPEFRKHFRHRAATIKSQIVRHFLPAFLRGQFPKISVAEGDERYTITEADLPKMDNGLITIGDHQFELARLKVTTSHDRQHAIYLCGNNRVVRSEKIKSLPDCKLREDGEDFYYQVYVLSDYLDKNVNQERTALTIEEDGEASLFGELTLSDLRKNIIRDTETYLAHHIGSLEERKQERVNKILSETFPEYAYIKEHNSDSIARIPSDATLNEIEQEVISIHIKNQKTGRALFKEVLEEVKEHSVIDLISLSKKFEERISTISAVNQANLASYMLFRRGVIDILEQILRKVDDSFAKEAAIHNLIFPMGKDCEGPSIFIDNNLWLIDERLTYAKYIASDKELRTHKVLFGTNAKDEPDLACYFNIGFSSDPTDGILHNIVFVEFKRPGPLPPRDENPYEQLVRYIMKLREKEVHYTEDGVKFRVGESTRFYCYIVCDLDNKTAYSMRIKDRFKPLFDGEEGYFVYHEELKAWFEAIPYERLLRDAKRNHRAFFERAGIP